MIKAAGNYRLLRWSRRGWWWNQRLARYVYSLCC